MLNLGGGGGEDDTTIPLRVRQWMRSLLLLPCPFWMAIWVHWWVDWKSIPVLTKWLSPLSSMPIEHPAIGDMAFGQEEWQHLPMTAGWAGTGWAGAFLKRDDIARFDVIAWIKLGYPVGSA
jgi:hypothetical protein